MTKYGKAPSRDWSWKEETPAQDKPKAKGKLSRKDRKRKKRKERKADVEKSNFYRSWEWKKLRFRVLKHYGATCMCCGASRMDGKVIVVDHIYPRKKFPALAMDFNNLQVLCNDCNMGKSDDDYTDFREQLPDGAYEHLDSILRH